LDKRRYELRDDGHLVGRVEILYFATPMGEPRIVEFAVDAGGSSHKVTLFNPAISTGTQARRPSRRSRSQPQLVARQGALTLA